MKNVLITGASGYLGMKLTAALAQHSDTERIVGVDIRPPHTRFEKLVFVKQDVRAPMDEILQAHAVDTVIHAAYVLPPLHDTALMEDINLNGTRNVLAAAARANVRHLLYTSSTTAYGFHPDNPVPLTEESPLRGNDDFTYAKNKKEIEFIIKEFMADHGRMTITVLRPCFVVGPGFDNPLARYLQKRFVFLPRKTAPFQFVHEDDLANAVLLCLVKELGGVFNVAGEGTLTFGEMVGMLGNVPVYLPASLLYVANQLFWGLKIRAVTEFPSPALNMVRYPWIASSKRLVDNTGFRFLHDSRSAFESFVRMVAKELN